MEQPWPIWWDATGRSAVDQSLRRLYADLDAAVAARGPRCDASGRCCQFDAYGHRLYVTGLEIAWLLRQLPAAPDPNPQEPSPRPASALNILPQTPPLEGGCRFQKDRLCTVHRVRPMGCRVFFCEKGTEDWQHALYEDFLARLRRLHDAHTLPYAYLEWRHGLQEAVSALAGV